MLAHPHRPRLMAVTAAIALVAGSGTVTTTMARPASAAGCAATITPGTVWGDRYNTSVTVSGAGTWSVVIAITAPQTVSTTWSAAFSTSGNTLTVTPDGSGNTFGFTTMNNGNSTARPRITGCNGDGGTTPATPAATLPADNPDWGKALPPADAVLSHAYHIVADADGTGYTPRASECSREIHARYWTYGPDGKVYPTWHPPRDPSGCPFGHEHGDDPRTSDLFGSVGWPPFGYTSEVLMDSQPLASHRHEDHVGHKVLAVNNSAVIQGDDGTSFFPPSGATIATCDILLKFHQGTHSPDAFSNNNHELLLNQRCATPGGQVTEVRYSALIALGRAGGFSPSECPGFGGQFINVQPAVPADSPSDTRSLGRLITEPGCIQAIRDGRTHYDPLYPDPVPFTVSDMDDFWFSDVQVTGAGLNFHLAPLFYVVNPSRYYDPSLPSKMGRIVDLCYTSLAGGSFCGAAKQVTQQTGQRVAWDDPRSPFKGTLREFRPGTFTLTNTGPTTIYTDSYGQNASTTPFAGSIAQYFSGNSTSMYVRGAIKDYGATAADQIHAPN